MGVNFSRGNATWSYRGFAAFRRKLSCAIGIDLSDMLGFELYAEREGRKPLSLPWDDVTDDVKPLLLHSDCDGELTVEECRRVAPRLRGLVSRWPADDWDRIMADKLADGMDEAADAGEPLEFR